MFPKSKLIPLLIVWVITVGLVVTDIVGLVWASPPDGLLYQYTKSIPEQPVHQLYSQYHWFFFPLPLLLTGLMWRWWQNTKRKHRERVGYVNSQLRTIMLWPSAKDTTSWGDTAGFWQNLYNLFGNLPQAEENNRLEFGIFACFGIASHVGTGIEYYTCLPFAEPEPDPSEPEAEPEV